MKRNALDLFNLNFQDFFLNLQINEIILIFNRSFFDIDLLKFLFKVWIIQEIIEIEKSQKFTKNLEKFIHSQQQHFKYLMYD